jgi:GntR family transcriptional regulator, N-acetylglucosamine utilization regulator
LARFRLELGPVPLHHQVYVDLLASLDAGRWPAGQQVPTERELAAHYGCSLITVRRALDELVREGRIERTRGRGTFVLHPRMDRDIAGRASFSEEMRQRGLSPETRLVSARPESATVAVAGALAIEAGSPTLYLERLRLASGEPYLLEQVHLPAEPFPGLLAMDLEHGSLYELLSTRYDTQVVRAREALEPVLLRAREARLLDQRRGGAGLPLSPAPHRRHRVRRRRRPGRIRPDVRSRRSLPVFRRAIGRPSHRSDRGRGHGSRRRS